MDGTTHNTRLFSALMLPDPVREMLTAPQNVLKRQLQGRISWVPACNIHLTLKFLGNIPETLVPDIRAVLAGAVRNVPAYGLEVRGAGAFPAKGEPRVIWAGTGQGAAETAVLAGKVDAALVQLGVPAETRPFRAHITLGRVKTAAHPEVMRHTLKTLTYAPAACTITSISLVRSSLHPLGARYDVVDTFALEK